MCILLSCFHYRMKLTFVAAFACCVFQTRLCRGVANTNYNHILVVEVQPGQRIYIYHCFARARIEGKTYLIGSDKLFYMAST